MVDFEKNVEEMVGNDTAATGGVMVGNEMAATGGVMYMDEGGVRIWWGRDGSAWRAAFSCGIVSRFRV